MPLYDVLLMAKSRVARRDVMDLVKGVASQVLAQDGVVTNVKSYGRVLLAYEIKKRDGWHTEVCRDAVINLPALASTCFELGSSRVKGGRLSRLAQLVLARRL